MKIRIIICLSLILFFCFQSIGFGKPVTAQEYFNHAAVLYISGEIKGALKNLDIALKIDPGNAAAWQLKSSILREQKVIDIKGGVGVVGKPTIVSYSLGFLLLALLLALVGLLFYLGMAYKGMLTAYKDKILEKIGVRKRTLVCFKCKAKLPQEEEFCPYCGTRVGLKMWHSISGEQELWYAKLGWTKNPFNLDCHPELYTGYKTKVKEILEKISARSGHVLIVGPLGIGKTTLLRWLATYLPKELRPVYISRPPQEFNQLVRFIIQSMGFTPKGASEYDIYNLDKLRRKLGKGLVLLIDEAHEFTVEIERPLRTLGDLDEVVLVMAGLPETVGKLKHEIRPLYERLVLEVSLSNLEIEDLKELIKVRIEDAGGTGTHPFNSDALNKIYKISKGNSRTALKLCDGAVTQAINRGEDIIGAKLIGKMKGAEE